MQNESDEIAVIVLDGGSGSFKAGFAGDEEPQSIFPSLVGSHQQSPHHQIMDDLGAKKANFVGKEITERKHLSLRYPIEHGIVINWDDYELLCAHSFQQLRTDPEELPVLMSDPPLNPLANKERMMELFFEAFNVPGFYLANTSQLNLYSSGRNCAVVIDVGDGVTSVVPFYESHSFCDAVKRQDFAGRDLTFYLQRLLHEKGYSFTTTSELEQVRQIKESLGYISSDYMADLSSKVSSTNSFFTLPDGNKVEVSKERFQCPEALFDPSMAGFPSLKGLPDLIDSCLSMCGPDVQGDIRVNCLLCGSCSLFPGFKDRLQVELEKRWPPIRRIRVVPIDPVSYSTWIGGSILGSLSTFQGWWVSKQDYLEKGPSLASTNTFIW